MGSMLGDDEGWGDAAKGMGWSPFPGLALRRQARKVERGELDPLLALRTTFVMFVTMLVTVGVVVVLLAAFGGLGASVEPTGALVGGVAVVGVLCLLAATRFGALDCTNEEALGNTYRTRFFLRVAFADTSAVVGFLGFVLTGRPFVYVVGAAFTALAFAVVAPTARNLAREQQRLVASGCGLSLVDAIRRRPGSSEAEA